MATKRATAGQPKIEIEWSRVEMLAAVGATQEEIAVDLGITVDTMRQPYNLPHFVQAYNRGLTRCKLSLRSKQFAIAMGRPALVDDKGKDIPGTAIAANPTMLIWLGKQLLNQSDTHVVKFASLEDALRYLAELFPGVTREGLLGTGQPPIRGELKN